MQRVLDWLKKKGDQSVVQYSRFGLPGEETDDRPPPTAIHVASFADDDRQFMAFGAHAQKSSVVSAGIGMCVVIFVFLCVFFEFDWYHHRKGVDMSALFGLVMFLLLGVLVHWYVIKGIKEMQSRFLVPFIIVYAALLLLEFLFLIFSINQWIALSYVHTFASGYSEPGALILLLTAFALVMLCQGGMVFSVVRCRNYLEKKSIHQMEMRVVEKSKQQYPGIRVVYGNDTSTPTVTVANESVSSTSFPNPVNADNGDVSPPPSYEDSTTAAAPQRTILNGREEV